jgi:hypothetical protein
MIVLDTSTRSLTIVLAGAKNTNDAPFVASYVDEPVGSTSSKAAASSNPSTTNGVTAVTVMSAPGLAPGWRRRLVSFNLNNADLAAITLSIGYVDVSTTYVVFKCTLQTLEQLVYEEGFGFRAYDSNGAEKSQAAATSSATSTAQAAASQASSMASIALLGSSQASSIAAAIVPASINSVSSQASSLAAGIVIASVNSVSSQASSMAALVPASVSSNASLGTLGSSQASSLLTRWSVTISKTSSSFSF